jgi:hypothetical protein
MSAWVKVYKTDNPVRAEIVKAVLSDNDLPAVVVDKKDRNYLFGHYEVLVAPDHVFRALKIIQDDISFE